MVQIIPAGTPKRPSFSQRLNVGVGKGLEMGQQMMQQAQQRQAMEQAGFGDLVGLDPDLQKIAIAERLKGQNQQNKVMTPLQQSQQALNEERLKQIQGQQQLFEQLKGGGPQPSAEGQPQQGGIQTFPDEGLNELAAFAGQPGQQGVIGNKAKAELDRRREAKKAERQEFQQERGYHSEYSKKAEEKANALRESLPKKEMALDFARNAIETADLGYFSLDKIADVTGVDLFRTAKGAQLITASKENLLSNMGRVSARAQNIWFEQRLNQMFPKIGQSKEANLTVQEMLEGEKDIDKAYLNEFDRLAAEDEAKYGFVRKDIERRAYDSIKPIEKDILRRTTYRMKQIEEEEGGLNSLKSKVGKNVSRGTPLTLAMAKLYQDKFGDNALAVAEKNGYYIPTYEEYLIISSGRNE